MKRSSRSRRSSSAQTPKGLLWAIALVLLAVGVFLGMQLAKPPPRPDFSTPSSSASEPSYIDPRMEEEESATQSSDSLSDSSVLDPSTLDPSADALTDEGSGEIADHTVRDAVNSPLEIRRQTPPAAGQTPPRIAIVIDDLGRSLRDLDRLAALNIPVTYAVLPFESHTSQVVAELRKREEEMICHLPMEAKGGNNPGPGALLLQMSREQLVDATRRALEAVPGAVGVNNHMGSGIASNREAITAVMSVVAERQLFFLDSRTSADTLGFSVARQLGLRAGERQVFLDTEKDRDFIDGQFARLLQVAQQRGAAIAIGHPYAETLEILADRVPDAVAQGFEFVTVSALLDE